jgi:hypothetical protein
MAMGLTAFRRSQISNIEGTPGLAEAAVEILYGKLSIPLGDKVLHQPEQDRNSLSRFLADDFIVARQIDFSFEGEVNHRHAPWWFSNAIRGNITPTQPNATTKPLSYLWTFEPGITSANTPDAANGIDTFTWEFGDNVQSYEAEMVFTRTIEISGGPNEPCKVSIEMTGRQLTESTITSPLTAQSVQYMPFNLCKFYIDPGVATWGATQKLGILRAFTWKLETQFTPRYGADGALYYTNLNEDRKNVELELTYYRDGTISETEKNKYDARATTYLRIALFGQTALDAAQSNPPYIYLDGAYRYSEWPEMDDEDGSAVETVTAQSVYDSTGSKEYSVKVYTDLASFPA